MYSMGDVCRLCASFLWSPFSKLLKSDNHSHSLRDWSNVPFIYMPCLIYIQLYIHYGYIPIITFQYSFSNLTYLFISVNLFFQRSCMKFVVNRISTGGRDKLMCQCVFHIISSDIRIFVLAQDQQSFSCLFNSSE